LTAYSLAHGQRVFATEIRNEGQPVQVDGTYRWRDHVLVLGRHQQVPGIDRAKASITVIGAEGEVESRFPVAFPCETLAVDGTHDLLLCLQHLHEKDPHELLDPQVIRMLQLPSGNEIGRQEVPILEHMTTDSAGGLYVLRRPGYLKDASHKPGLTNGLIEKYSLKPWTKIWSVEVAPERGYVQLIALDQGALSYAIFDTAIGGLLDDQLRWVGGPMDPRTGKPLADRRRYDPYSIDTVVRGKRYQITRTDKGGLRVHAGGT
jgi:hypothetical protein